MNILYQVILIFFLLSQVSIVVAQNKIYGHINSTDNLTNVNISIVEIDKFTISDLNGNYEFNELPEGNYTLLFSHVGYKNQTRNVYLKKDQSFELNIILDRKMIELSEAMVYSSRSEVSVKELSLPMELIDRKKLEVATSTTISDVLRNESGISVMRDGPWATTANIRGLSGQNIVYLIDGNRVETSTNIAAGLSLMDMNDLERVEVVKGGISSLYGTGATGGVINIQSKKAKFAGGNYITSQFINGYNSVNNGYSNYLNLKLGDYNWSAKINGSFRRADDTKTPNGSLSNSSFQDESFSGGFNYSPITNLLLKINYQNFSAYDVGIPGGKPFPQTATAKYNYAKRKLLQTSIEYNNITQSLIKSQAFEF